MSCAGAAQDCTTSIGASIDEQPTFDINTTAPVCFIFSLIPIVSCELNDKLLNSAPPNVVFTEFNRTGIVMINNWTTLNYENLKSNELSCNRSVISIMCLNLYFKFYM